MSILQQEPTTDINPGTNAQESQRLDTQELGKQVFGSIAQKIHEAMEPLKEAAQACFQEVQRRCELVAGYGAAVATGKGEQATAQALEGFKHELNQAAAFVHTQWESGVKAFQDSQTKARIGLINDFADKHLDGMQKIKDRIVSEDLAEESDKVYEQLKEKTNAAINRVTSPDESGSSSVTVTSEQLSTITKELTQNFAEAQAHLASIDRIDEAVETSNVAIRDSRLNEADQALAVRTIEFLKESYKEASAEVLKDGPADSGLTEMAQNRADSMVAEVTRTIEVLERISAVAQKAANIGDENTSELATRLRNEYSELSEDGNFSEWRKAEMVEVMEKELKAAETWLKVAGVRQAIGTQLSNIANAITPDLKRKERADEIES